VFDFNQAIGHWGYLAIFFFVVLGNMGLPLPEETILILAGYLVWNDELVLPIVLAVGILSAVVGDNLGYWIGREFGRKAIERYGHWILATPKRMESIECIVVRYGARAVFAARFLPGLRFLAGPTAGATGLPPLPFFVANVLGALIYVPFGVGLGYLVGYGLGDYVARMEHIVGRLEYYVFLLALFSSIAYIFWRFFHAKHEQQES
jgi:membrane protein DedA with SNARE-associated domain